MAKIEKLEDRHRSDRLAANLALAAAEDGKPGEDCLDAEQLADIAAGLCTPEQRQKAIAHFASCQACYDSWVAVSFSLAAMERGTASPRKSLLTGRNLGYLGSAFAVAVSVAVFLNVRQEPLEHQFSPVPAQQESSLSTKATDFAMEKEEAGDGAADRVMVQETAVQGQRVQADSAEPQVREAAGGGQELPDAGKEKVADYAAVQRSAETPSGARGAGTPQGAAAPSGERPGPEAWLEAIQEACLGPAGDPAVWQSLHAEGKELLARSAEGDGSAESRQERIADVVNLLAAMDSEEQIAVQCARIRRLLAQEPDTE